MYEEYETISYRSDMNLFAKKTIDRILNHTILTSREMYGLLEPFGEDAFL